MRSFTVLLILACYAPFIHAQKLNVYVANNKKGYKDEYGNIKIVAKYINAERFKNGYAKVEILSEVGDFKYGIIDMTGKEIIPLKYTHLGEEFQEGLIAAELNGKWGFINAKNETVVPFNYEYVKDFYEGFVAVRSNKKWGFINALNVLKIPCTFDDVRQFKEGKCAVQLYDKWGFINAAGAQVVTYKFDDVSYGGFCGGITGAKQKDKWAVINTAGKELTGYKYGMMENSYYNHSLSIMKVGIRIPTGWLYGVVDAKGTEIIPVKYNEITIYDYNLIVAKTGKTAGALNTKNKTVLPFDYLGIFMIKDYQPNGVLYKLGEENNTRVFSLEGEKINIWKYENVQEEAEGLRAATYNKKWGFFNVAGGEPVPFIYDTVTNFSGGYSFVMLNKKVGFVNKTGNVVLSIKYDAVYNFVEKMAAVTAEGKWGFIDDQFKETVPLKYDKATDFTEGYATVQSGKFIGAINKKGTVIVPILYDDVDTFSDGMFAVIKAGKIGFVDATGKEVIACQFEKMERKFYNGKAKVVKNGKVIVIDKAGSIVK